ncbi:hypothetical protein Q9292_10010 [Methylophilus sp. VKM B-3414]|uniref:hypothetical protein n=1 Tax=Methylophilus sp. VKM B-3414 TaxID=3076121 RepID=UPI0028CADBD7|nr:hypothetical protein [Methylophilus sp. VKM B-3414]MDT7849945.1 hypothetical protein [Methylophilus sp. VKM B-3414]
MSTSIEEIERKHEEIGKMIAILKALKTTFPRTIEAPELREGEIYVGTFINANGTGHHTILLPGDKDDSNWQDAIDWAKEKGGDLPNRIEQSMLFANHKGLFQENWYWTNTTHHKESEWAWCQGFSNGNQYGTRESHDLCRARAVRRLEI